MTEISGSNLYPTFEIGSLAFFRSEKHIAFVDHLGSASNLAHQQVADVPLSSLSASLMLPKQSVWNFRSRLGHGPSPAQATPYPQSSANANIDSISGMVWNYDPIEAKTALLADWEVVVQDLRQQAEKPGLKSGRTTVLDEGNLVARLRYGLLICIEMTI
ncbi:hypothetical protein N0V84_005455 [Fusarium piperis]|uniref:Uncharacterized protein n=1 Tax=Fusarium piperis TaxID=1435070 RepID=A0A9W8WE10_9HYPO|nr:hypothetical protein N0V84_005455 [Fusarium piperis]